MWEAEVIPDKHSLYCRVHINNIDVDDSRPRGIAFKNPKNSNSLSSDWEKYSTPEETRNRAADVKKDPNNYSVISLNKELIELRVISQKVIHTPDYKSNNRSHSDIEGEKSDKERLKFQEIYKWEIKTWEEH